MLVYQTYLSPKSDKGEKAVVVQIIIPRENIDKTFTYHTDLAFVSELLEAEKIDLQVQTQHSSYGDFISGMMGVVADESCEFFYIKVNGDDAMVGISQLPLEDGSTYAFILTGFST